MNNFKVNVKIKYNSCLRKYDLVKTGQVKKSGFVLIIWAERVY